jgi:hypothetical protein
MAEHFYDGQIRKYLVQIMRLFSNFSYRTGDDTEKQVPVLYGDLTRQVGSILRDNSENKIPSAPRMAVYITGLELDRDRTSDSSYINKRHVRERAKDSNGDYTSEEGRKYTVERLMPTPYRLTVNVDIWSTNTDMKLQIMEQILMLFNPSLDIQTTDNYLDWTSLTTVMLESVNFSSRAIPVGVDSEIDVGQMTFSTPIYISPPAKVKRLGVVTNIVTSIFDGDGYYDFEKMLEGTNLFSIGGATQPYPMEGAVDSDKVVDTGAKPSDGDGVLTPRKQITRTVHPIVKNPLQHRVLILNSEIQLLENGLPSNTIWTDYFDQIPGRYKAGLSIMYFRKPDISGLIAGRITVNPLDETKLVIEWDRDTLPTNDTIQGPARNINQYSSVDYIIDPLRYDPKSDTSKAGVRLLILGAIGGADNTDGADAWKNTDNTDFVAGANDIIEYDGANWHIVFDASKEYLPYNNETITKLYTTNLNTGVQYYWDGDQWLLSVDGEYAKGDWVINLDG